MKSFFVLILLFVFTNSFAQTKTIYARFTKGDGARIKGTSTMRGYEDQLIVVNYTGGADNTAIIEIEVPTSACIADFRNMMNTAPKATQPAIAASKPVATSAIKPANAATAGLPEKTITVPSLATFPISRIDISITNRVNNSVPTLTNQVILEDAKVESCTDIPASSTTRIKLKANRIGWIYFNTDPKTGKPTTTNKSGWDVIAGGSWTNF